MNKIFLVLSVIFLFACQHTVEDKLENNTKQHHSNLAINNNSDTTHSTNTSFDLASSLKKELKEALQDPATDEYFIQIYNQGRIIKRSDAQILSITDSLFSNDVNKDFFYFLVFTKSMNGSDGFYSEAIGLSALKYITTNTETFAYYFSNGPNLTDNDVKNWANFIIGEIQISRENQESEAIKELENTLKTNVKKSKKDYAKVIKKLIDQLEIIRKEKIPANI